MQLTLDSDSRGKEVKYSENNIIVTHSTSHTLSTLYSLWSTLFYSHIMRIISINSIYYWAISNMYISFGLCLMLLVSSAETAAALVPSIQVNHRVAQISNSNVAAGRLPILSLRGGSLAGTTLQSIPKLLTSTPDNFFNAIFASLFGSALVWKVADAAKKGKDGSKSEVKPAGVKDLQAKFLSVFWLIRMAGNDNYRDQSLYLCFILHFCSCDRLAAGSIFL